MYAGSALKGHEWPFRFTFVLESSLFTFISYSRRDQVFVRSLASQLRDAGVAIWIDQQDILPGKRWDQEIEAALNACSHLLVVLSDSSVESENVVDEVSLAISLGKRVVPLRICECSLPLRMKRIQYVDISDKDISEIVEFLKRELPHHSGEIEVDEAVAEQQRQIERWSARGLNPLDGDSRSTSNLVGCWIRESPPNSYFFRQIGQKVIGFYDRNVDKKVGLYIGEIEAKVFNFEWRWLDGRLGGHGKMELSADGLTLDGFWTPYSNSDDQHPQVLRREGSELPAWVNDYDFEQYRIWFEDGDATYENIHE